MAVTPQTFTERFSNFSLQTEQRFNFLLSISKPHVSFDIWGDQYENALFLLIAHQTVLLDRGAGGGSLTSISTGSLSESYASPFDDNILTNTAYGNAFLSLRQAVIGFVGGVV